MINTSWLLEKCRSSIGWQYVFGSAQAGVVDCSGLFVYWCGKKGLKLSHGTNTMWRNEVTDKRTINGDKSQLQVGDIVFRCKDWTGDEATNRWYGTEPGNVSHVGIYTGNGTVIEAKGEKYGVVESPWDKKWILAGRFKGTVSSLPVINSSTEFNSSGKTKNAAELTKGANMKYTVTTESGNLNIRKEPSTGSAKVGSIAPGTIIEAENYNDQWAHTTHDGVVGYVSKQFLTVFEDKTIEVGDTVNVVLPRELFNALRLAFNEVGGD